MSAELSRVEAERSSLLERIRGLEGQLARLREQELVLNDRRIQGKGLIDHQIVNIMSGILAKCSGRVAVWLA